MIVPRERGRYGGKDVRVARVSSRDQNLNRQLDALEEFGLEKGKVFSDKASGKDFN
jgi:DNA invertase Pin-like site-specific DNA recombinase